MTTQHAVMTTRSSAGLAGRVLFTLLGAAGLVVGAFLHWWQDTAGTDLTIRSLYQMTFSSTGDFVQTVGFASIVLGLVAVLGLAAATGWLTRLAGALGIAAVVLFGIQVYRDTTSLEAIDLGAWVALAGGVVALLGGFLGRPVPVVTSRPVTDTVDDHAY
jgi:hypothetical protein